MRKWRLFDEILGLSSYLSSNIGVPSGTPSEVYGRTPAAVYGGAVCQRIRINCNDIVIFGFLTGEVLYQVSPSQSATQ
jgi:hypothetical protein